MVDMEFSKCDEVIGLGRQGKPWPSRPAGKVTAVREETVLVAWHGTVVEVEMRPCELEPVVTL